MKIKCQRPGKPVRVWGHLFERAMIDGLSTACVAAYVRLAAYQAEWGIDIAPRSYVKRSELRKLVAAGWAEEVNKTFCRIKLIDWHLRTLEIERPRPPRPRRSMKLSLRFRVLQRDGFRCVYCGASAETTELQVDHVDPVSAGGTDDEDNLVTACIACNLGKSDTLISAGADDA